MFASGRCVCVYTFEKVELHRWMWVVVVLDTRTTTFRQRTKVSLRMWCVVFCSSDGG